MKLKIKKIIQRQPSLKGKFHYCNIHIKQEASAVVISTKV